MTLRILSSRIHLSTEKPRGATAPAENMIISRIPQSTTKKSKRLNRDMKYALGPRAYIFTNISRINSTSSTRLATSVEIREGRRTDEAGNDRIYLRNIHNNTFIHQPCREVSQPGWWWYSVAMVRVLRKTRNTPSQ